MTDISAIRPLIENDQFIQEFEEGVSGSFICTSVAQVVFSAFQELGDIKIYGFSQAENPEAKYFLDEDEDPDEGHHFCVIEDRFIIDPWVYGTYSNYPETCGRALFDLEDPSDQDLIHTYYGRQDRWTRLGHVEAAAAGDALKLHGPALSALKDLINELAPTPRI